MQDLLDALGRLIGVFFDLAQGGFDGVNQIVGLLIAVVAALLMQGWGRLFPTALGATLAHVVIGVLRPVLDGGAFALPPLMSMTFWMTVLALFLGYSIVIAVFFFIRTLLLGGRRHAHAH